MAGGYPLIHRVLHILSTVDDKLPTQSKYVKVGSIAVVHALFHVNSICIYPVRSIIVSNTWYSELQ